jgi:maltose alpha-D-glucosyltransferase / alpha-amylase
VNVADQRRDPNSLLNWMERIIRMRKEVPEIGWGDFSFIPAGTSEVLAIQYEWRNNSVLCVHNLSGKPKEVRLSPMTKEKNCVLANLLSNDNSQPEASGRYSMLLEPYGYRWFRVCGLDYLLKRSAV